MPGYRQDARAAPAAIMIAAQEIETKLLDFLKREVFAPEVVVTPETDLIAAGFDSMSLVRVLLFLEQTYGFWIPEGDITGDALLNVRTLATTAAGLLNAR
jgi:D-alanine--poly(phosphoribitol) ligase subunit 2